MDGDTLFQIGSTTKTITGTAAMRLVERGLGVALIPRLAAQTEISRKQLVGFTRQLSTLQDAGLPILRSLQILEQQQKPGLLKAITMTSAP